MSVSGATVVSSPLAMAGATLIFHWGTIKQLKDIETVLRRSCLGFYNTSVSAYTALEALY